MTRSDESYICLSIQCSADRQNRVVAELSDIGVMGCEQKPDSLLVYLVESRWTVEVQSNISTALLRAGVNDEARLSRVKPQNWTTFSQNKTEPVQAGMFFIHPTWCGTQAMPTGSIPIKLDPRMSFGTGHHESTRLILRHVSDENKPGRVLDVGTGTGILAIAVALRGASEVIAVDTDTWSMDNAQENLFLNGMTKRVELRLGSLECVEGDRFDLIMANINFPTIRDLIPRFGDYLLARGRVVLSGLNISDLSVIKHSLCRVGFRTVSEHSEGEWSSVKAELDQ